MFFTTITFFIFFCVFFILYWGISPKKSKWQNFSLFIGSSFFYANFSWAFYLLLLMCIAIFYLLGHYIYQEKRENIRQYAMWGGILIGIGMLTYFKYMDFFINSFIHIARELDFSFSTIPLEIIAPIGISFYTFKFISYLVDIYQDEYEPNEDILTFACYILFFPSIVSGPIDRPKKLISQFSIARNFNYTLAVDGCRQFLWGLFKKWVVADNCVFIVNRGFEDITGYNGSTLLLGAMLYLIQIYADFSGYSDMAIGIGKVFGIRLTINFHYPLFAINIADFWRRWHISLTSWMTDYIFTPLCFYWRRFRKAGIIAAVIINFIIVGLWHGANWTFVVYGLLNGMLFIPLIAKGTLNSQTSKHHIIKRSFTFLTMSLLVVFFKSNTLAQAFSYIKGIFSISLFYESQISNKIIFIFTITMLSIEWINRNREHGLELSPVNNRITRYIIYLVLIFLCFIFRGEVSEFIYQQY